jgi:alginate O-acetyltransferase complex protein AlgI
MVFNSYTFIVFFIVVLCLHYMPLSWKTKKTNLLLASYLFYAVWNPPFILLLLFSTFLDFFVGKALHTEENTGKRKLLLGLSLLGNLGPLAYFKYGNFLLDNFKSLVATLGVNFQAPAFDIILPVGISFYTFQTLCYSLDMYNRKYKPVNSFLDFGLFVTFFPQLVAGPIVRPDELIPQFESPKQASSEQFFKGCFLLIMGLFMKVVLADSLLAQSANDVFNASDKLIHPMDAWAGVLAFSGQIFFDFGGYSTCAIGIALCLGFTITDNFLYPYAAIGFSDFWKRWHITLSTWLRDYLYIPLGGNRHGIARTYIALMLTMLIGGLWHGANWTFVVWGGLHGLYLCLERILKSRNFSLSIPPFFYALFTFFLVLITWVFFRAQTFTAASNILTSMFTAKGIATPILSYLNLGKVFLIMTLTLACHWYMRDRKLLSTFGEMPTWKVSIAWSFMLILLILSQESTSSFIYFQF